MSTKLRASGAGRHSSSPAWTWRTRFEVDSRTVSEKSARRSAEEGYAVPVKESMRGV